MTARRPGRRRTLAAVASVAAIAAWTSTVRSQTPVRVAPETLPATQARLVAGIKILSVRNNVYVLMGAGGNITALLFPTGITLVDSGLERSAEGVLAALRSLSRQPITYIINTHVHPDHVGGNETLALSGRQITGGNVVGNEPDIGRSAEVIAHENVLNRMLASATGPPPTPLAQPATTYHSETLKLSTFYHGDAIELVHAQAAHTDGDTIVWFRQNDIIATGDIFTADRYPRIDVERGGSINGEIDALNHIIDIAFPEFRLEGGTLIVPGHGRLADVADVAYYRDMVTIVRDRVQDLKTRGRTLAEIQAAGVTRDYDGIYGTSPDDPPTGFVEAVYKSLPVVARPTAGAASRKGRGRK